MKQCKPVGAKSSLRKNLQHPFSHICHSLCHSHFLRLSLPESVYSLSVSLSLSLLTVFSVFLLLLLHHLSIYAAGHAAALPIARFLPAIIVIYCPMLLPV